MPSNCLLVCRPLLHLPSIFPSIRVFSNESALRIRWPKHWIFSFCISLSSGYKPMCLYIIYVCMDVCVCACPTGTVSVKLLLFLFCLNPDWYKEFYPNSGEGFWTSRQDWKQRHLWKGSLWIPSETDAMEAECGPWLHFQASDHSRASSTHEGVWPGGPAAPVSPEDQLTLAPSQAGLRLFLGEGANQTVFLPEANEIHQTSVTLGLAKHLLFWSLRLSTNLGKNLLPQLTLERLPKSSLQRLRLGMLFKLPGDTTECRISWGWGWRRARDVSNPGSSFFRLRGS